MPKKTLQSLPKPLQYLQPFVRFLSKVPREQVNEDLDLSLLESALRKRLRGLDEQAASEAMLKDRDTLERWLKTSASPHHPAYYLLGTLTYFSVTDAVQELLHPPEPPPPRPTISFDAPDGWKVTAEPSEILVKKGKLLAWISAIGKFTFEVQLKQKKWLQGKLRDRGPPGVQATLEIKRIRFGDVTGKKYVYRQTLPLFWKRVDYLWRVPGGFVDVMLDASGADFDEAPFELRLHTLRSSTTARKGSKTV